MSGILQMQGVQSGIPEGTKSIGPLQILMSNNSFDQPVTLVNGDNVIPIPAGFNAVIIEPVSVPVTTTISVRTRGAAGADMQMSNVMPAVIPLPTTLPASVIINASAPGGVVQVTLV